MTLKKDNNYQEDDKKLKILWDKTSTKLKQVIKVVVNRLPNKDELRFDKLGFEKNWKFIAPLVVSMCLVGIIKLIPISAFLLMMVMAIVIFIWIGNK